MFFAGVGFGQPDAFVRGFAFAAREGGFGARSRIVVRLKTKGRLQKNNHYFRVSGFVCEKAIFARNAFIGIFMETDLLLKALPTGSRLEVSLKGLWHIQLPQRGWNRSHVLQMLFVVLWFFFSWRWASTAEASVLAWVLALLFASVGVFTLLGLFRNVWVSESIILSDNGLRICSFVLWRKSCITVPRIALSFASVRTRSFSAWQFALLLQQLARIKASGNTGIESVAVGNANEVFYFFDMANAQEREWTVRVLKAWMLEKGAEN